MSKSNVASDKRIFATNNSPAIPASASTGSGLDHKDAKKYLSLELIVGSTR
jgi:hypothetical protein